MLNNMLALFILSFWTFLEEKCIIKPYKHTFCTICIWGETMKRIEEIIEGGINCLIPIYQPKIGNATKNFAEDGNIFIDGRTIKTVLRTLCQYYTIQIEY